MPVPNGGKSAACKRAQTHGSNGSLSQASQFPSTSTSPTKAPANNFKLILAKLSDEFDQVSTILDKEIDHRVLLEAQVASLSAELKKQAEMTACGASRWRLHKDELYRSKEKRSHDLDHPVAPQVATVEYNGVMSKESDVQGDSVESDQFVPVSSVKSSRSSRSYTKDAHPDLEQAHKARKDLQIQDLELLKGWSNIRSHSKHLKGQQSFVKTAGVVRAHARRIVESQSFDAICSICIIYNAALLGASADYAAVNHSNPQKPPLFYRVSDQSCTIWFLFELIMRLSSAGIRDFFMGPLWTWNLFDFVVVASDVLMMILDTMASETQLNFSFLRMLRVLRVTRAIRVVRLVRFFKELRMMVFSVLRSGTSLLWSLILFGIIHYIFGIFLMQQVNDYLWDKYAGGFTSGGVEVAAEVIDLQKYWGSLFDSLFTMYACMSGGVSWLEVADDLREINGWNGVILGFFIFFCTVVVMNIITGIFVDTTIQSAQNDRDEIIQEQIHSHESELAKLKQAFLEADSDGSATITWPEFEEHVQDPHVRAHLASIGLEVHEAMGLFKLLDIDGSGDVGIEEFVIGCMRLKGSAKSIDLATLMYENKRMVEQHTHFHDFCGRKFDEILDACAAGRKAASD